MKTNSNQNVTDLQSCSQYLEMGGGADIKIMPLSPKMSLLSLQHLNVRHKALIFLL